MPPSEPRRVGDLLGMPVAFTDGRHAGFVNDIRVSCGPDRDTDTTHDLVVVGILVDGRHAGSLLGYDRRREQGPWVIRAIVRRLHRRAGYVPWSRVRSISWHDKVVRIDAGDLEPLEVV